MIFESLCDYIQIFLEENRDPKGLNQNPNYNATQTFVIF